MARYKTGITSEFTVEIDKDLKYEVHYHGNKCRDSRIEFDLHRTTISTLFNHITSLKICSGELLLQNFNFDLHTASLPTTSLT